MKVKLEASSVKKLLAAPSYRNFVEVLIEERCKSRRFGYADIARVGGFSARSFPRDVVKGSKRLTLASLAKFSRGLQLSGEWSEFFRILVEIEHPDCRTKTTDEVKLCEHRDKIKNRLLDRQNPVLQASDSAFEASNIPEVYAALGSPEKGASAGEIAKKTGFSLHQINSALDRMVAQQIALKRGQRYYASQTHLNFEGLRESDVFREHFVKQSERSARMAKVGMRSGDKLFFSSAFSVDEASLPKLKEELRAVLLKFVDTSEFSEGSKVVNLVTGFF